MNRERRGVLHRARDHKLGLRGPVGLYTSTYQHSSAVLYQEKGPNQRPERGVHDSQQDDFQRGVGVPRDPALS